MAFMATIDCFEIEDIANKVIPNIAFAMIDNEKCDTHDVIVPADHDYSAQVGERSGIQSCGVICEEIGKSCIDNGMFTFHHGNC